MAEGWGGRSITPAQQDEVLHDPALTWKRQDASTIVALGAAGVGYVITADHSPEDEEARYTLRLPTGAYTSNSLVRLILDAEEIERHAERRAAA